MIRSKLGAASIEESNDLSSNMLSPRNCTVSHFKKQLESDRHLPRFLMIHDTGRCGQNNEAELTGRKQLHDPLLEVVDADVVAGGDDTGFIDTITRDISNGPRVSTETSERKELTVLSIE